MSKQEFLQKITEIANEEAFKLYGIRSTCIFTSYGLNDALQRIGYNSRLLRIEAHIFPLNSRECATLGWDGDLGQLKRIKHPPSEWGGHLGVVVDARWLLDPTLDQVNSDIIYVNPSAVEVTSNFWTNELPVTFYTIGNCKVRWHPYYRQVGFKSKIDARKTQWGVLSDRIVERINNNGF